jgi:hypothetical protein
MSSAASQETRPLSVHALNLWRDLRSWAVFEIAYAKQTASSVSRDLQLALVFSCVALVILMAAALALSNTLIHLLALLLGNPILGGAVVVFVLFALSAVCTFFALSACQRASHKVRSHAAGLRDNFQ